MPELTVPASGLHAAWFESHAEWDLASMKMVFGLPATDEVDSSAGFNAWVERLAGDRHCT